MKPLQIPFLRRQMVHAMPVERRRPIAALVFFAIASLTFGPRSLSNTLSGEGQWVSAWQGSPTPGGTFDSSVCPSDVGLNGQTVRNVVYISAGGSSVRARISNAAGNDPLMVGAASIAISAGDAETVPGTLHPLRFGGKTSILVASGGEAVSDPVIMTVQALQTLAISVYLSRATGPATQHYFAQQDNYLGGGNQSNSTDGSGFNQSISCWMFLSGVDVKALPRISGTLITIGDSVTDGVLQRQMVTIDIPTGLPGGWRREKGPPCPYPTRASAGTRC